LEEREEEIKRQNFLDGIALTKKKGSVTKPGKIWWGQLTEMWRKKEKICKKKLVTMLMRMTKRWRIKLKIWKQMGEYIYLVMKETNMWSLTHP
jgi:hypothetical protein